MRNLAILLFCFLIAGAAGCGGGYAVGVAVAYQPRWVCWDVLVGYDRWGYPVYQEVCGWQTLLDGGGISAYEGVASYSLSEDGSLVRRNGPSEELESGQSVLLDLEGMHLFQIKGVSSRPEVSQGLPPPAS